MAKLESSDKQQVMYLHGDLDLYVIEARNLPNMDFLSKLFRRCLYIILTACHSSSAETATDGQAAGDRKIHHRPRITGGPYVKLVVPQVTLARTRVIKNATKTEWNQRFHIPMAHATTDLEFQVKDDHLYGADLIGITKIPAQKVASGEVIQGWFPIIGTSCNETDTSIRLEIKFTPFNKNPLYQHGIAGDPGHNGVRHSYFPLRKGNRVTLYRDAHDHTTTDQVLPEIELDGGNIYKREKCWEDICYAISEAHHLIYVVGWSVFHKIKLIREPTRPLPRGGDLNLGELLKYKSEEGVRVLLLVWNDRTSLGDSCGFFAKGKMETHDEETRKFFKHSSVICQLVPRYSSDKLNYFRQQIIGTIFTHHQKCVLVDTQASGNNRKISAFIGGLDLCDGRYDTPEHRLFRDLDTVYKGDFHNPTFDAGTKAPREPWHDLHCRVEGPAAYDVLKNFEQRWRKARAWSDFGLCFKRITHRPDDAMIKLERISWILSPTLSESKDGTTKDDSTLYVSAEEDPEHWHVQIFRSIDSGALTGFPKKFDDCYARNLLFSKNLVIDKSIQTAYIEAIRSAKHFIYIENQYFLGSSYAWPSYKDAGADHLIPMELALKIASKIRANERFAVYVIVPMWPEGKTNDPTTQEILYWQSQTMRMMYNVVAHELKSLQLVDSHPQDYLNFYCLGKREESSQDTSSTNGYNTVSDAQKFQRFMIYVHSKGMVVDDEYVILGSANINQRSMAGTKDTEIAMGAYQPYHTWAAKKIHPRGQIYGYRTSLWVEHLGAKHEAFMQPESLECVKKVNNIAEDNWKIYTDPNFKELQGQLLKYPIQVDADGKVDSIPGHEEFPDVGGKVLGAPSGLRPDILTT